MHFIFHHKAFGYYMGPFYEPNIDKLKQRALD